MSDGDLQAAYLSEHIGDEGEIPDWALYAPEDKLMFLLSMEDALDDPESSDAFIKTRRRLKAVATNKAIRNDDLTTVSAIKGISDNSVDATGYDMLLDRIEPAAQTILIKGAKGTGKTTKASDWVKKALEDGIIEKVMTNVQLAGFENDKFEDSDYDVRYSEFISDYLEFAKEPGEKLMLLDELSTVANAIGGNMEAQDIFPRVINALRKSKGGSCRVIAIGHQHDTDILPSLRNNSDGVLEAPNKLGDGIDRAIYYTSFDDYRNDDHEFKVRGLQDVTDDPLFGFDDNSFATLEFNLDAPEKQIKRGKLIDNWEKYQDEPDSVEGEDELLYCNKDECGSTSKQYPDLIRETGYCDYHQNLVENDTEDDGKENGFLEDSEENIDENAGHSDDYKF